MPSAQVILAADSWAASLAEREFARDTRPLICTPDGRWGDPVELRPSGDRVGDPLAPKELGKPEFLKRWRNSNADTLAIAEPLPYAAFTAVAQFPAMQASQLSRLLAPALIRRRGAYLIPAFRHRQRRHDDGVNRLVLQFASEGAAAFAGWRAEINVPAITQIRPDLVVLVTDGPLGSGAYCLEYERSATTPSEIIDKLRTYRKCAAVGQPVPLLMVCEPVRASGYRHTPHTPVSPDRPSATPAGPP